MTGYLATSKAKIQEKPKPHELSKLPKAPFHSFDGDGVGIFAEIGPTIQIAAANTPPPITARFSAPPG